MKREFIITKIFDRRWAELGLTDENLRLLQNHVLANPGVGNMIGGTGGLMKLRWNLPNEGKSGGIRVLYVDFIYYEKIVLVNCYSKSAKDTISSKEKAMYKGFIKEIRKELEQ